MRVTVISTGLTLASSVPALADQVDRSEREYAHALRQARDLGERLGTTRRMLTH